MDLKLIVIDLHGTLIKDDASFDKTTFNKLVTSLKNKSYTFVILSGHNRHDTKSYLNSINTKDLFIASHNGNVVYYNSERIRNVLIDSKTVQKTLSFLDQYPSMSVVLDDGYQLSIYRLLKKHLDPIKEEYPYLSGAKVDPNQPLLKIACYTGLTRPEVIELTNLHQSKFPTLDMIPRHKGWLEFHQVAGGKGEVVKLIQDHLNLTPDVTMVFGNQKNDCQAAQYAKYTMAVSNAASDFKALANYIIPSNNDEGVLEVLDRLDRYELSQAINKYKK